jgi:hypothetical protein
MSIKSKLVLFWVTFPFLGLTLLLGGVIVIIPHLICEALGWYGDRLSDFERWCFTDYEAIKAAKEAELEENISAAAKKLADKMSSEIEKDIMTK